MAQPTRKDIADAMKSLDICMMTTKAEDGRLTSRPMSNNAQVDYDGDSYFFSRTGTRKLREIEADPTVALDFEGEGLWLTIRGTATIHADVEMMRQHWTPDIAKWFGGELDADKVRLIRVEAVEAELYGRSEGVVSMA